MNTDALFKKVLAKVTPSKVERARLEQIINFTKTKLHNEFHQQKIAAEVIVGGSTAKDTWLAGNYDIDFFVKFDKKHEADSSVYLKKAVSKVFKRITVLQGSREYYQAKYKNFNLEFVPVLAIDSPVDAKNSMDASVFHINYIKRQVEKNPSLANQVRLFKAFAYSANVYGAETFIAGFSGYAIELLMTHYKTFWNMVNELNKAHPRIYIDLEHYYKTNQETEKALGEAKIRSPIILVDPVLKNRNAAAALNYNTFAKFLLAIRLFKRKPSAEFFKYKPAKLAELVKSSRKRGTILVYEKLKKPAEKEDVYFAKLNHTMEKISSRFKRAGLGVYNHGYLENPLVVYFEFETLKLSKFKKHVGPPVWLPDKYFDDFIKKWKTVYISDTNLAVDLQREYTDIAKYASKILKGELKNV